MSCVSRGHDGAGEGGDAHTRNDKARLSGAGSNAEQRERGMLTDDDHALKRVTLGDNVVSWRKAEGAGRGSGRRWEGKADRGTDVEPATFSDRMRPCSTRTQPQLWCGHRINKGLVAMKMPFSATPNRGLSSMVDFTESEDNTCQTVIIRD